MSWLKYRAPWAPIMGIIGHNGAGKSAMAVELVDRIASAAGKPVYSNITLRLPSGAPSYEIGGLPDLLRVRDALVLWDDVSAVAPARETMAAPPDIVMRMASLRHYGCALVWTSPTMGDVDVKLRQVTQLIVAMKALRQKPVPGELWPATTWTMGRAYDIKSTEVTDINEKTPTMGWGLRKIATLPLDAYNTLEEIELKANHAVCLVCGKPRRREYCTGKHSAEQRPQAVQLLDDVTPQNPQDAAHHHGIDQEQAPGDLLSPAPPLVGVVRHEPVDQPGAVQATVDED